MAEAYDTKAAKSIDLLEEGLDAATAVLTLPWKYQRRLRSTNMVERLIEELRRRERVIRIFPNEASAERLMGAVLVEWHETWMTGQALLHDGGIPQRREGQPRCSGRPPGSLRSAAGNLSPTNNPKTNLQHYRDLT